MSRERIVPSSNNADSALSDEDLDGVVGGRSATCSHGSTTANDYFDPPGQTLTKNSCPGPSGTLQY
jgi:hypothetical protein